MQPSINEPTHDPPALPNLATDLTPYMFTSPEVSVKEIFRVTKLSFRFIGKPAR